jgi:hypothetical protein
LTVAISSLTGGKYSKNIVHLDVFLHEKKPKKRKMKI